MAEKKHISFALLQILQEETDANHPLSANELMKRINRRLNLDIERRTIYSNIDILRQAGYDISDYSENGKGYWLKTRQFDKGEILLLCNAVHASHFISSEQSDALIRKLLGTLSTEERKQFTDNVYLPNHQKSANDTLFRNIEKISEAIAEKKKVSFTYLRYNAKKKLAPRRNEPYITEPRYIVYNDGRGYMICTSPNHPGFSHYRLDRMKKVVLMDEKTAPLGTDMDPYSYTKSKLFMFAGDNITAELKCSEKILSQMLDIFGPGTEILDDEEGFFRMHVEAPEQGILWLVQEATQSLTGYSRRASLKR